MTDDDTVASNNEKGIVVEYVPDTLVKRAYEHGFACGVFVTLIISIIFQVII